MTIDTTAIVRDEGTIVVFEGLDPDNNIVTFAVDHRCAADLALAVSLGQTAYAEVDPWQILSVRP